MRQRKQNVYHMGLVTRLGAEKSLMSISNKKFRDHYPVPPPVVVKPFDINVKMYHNNIFIAGNNTHCPACNVRVCDNMQTLESFTWAHGAKVEGQDFSLSSTSFVRLQVATTNTAASFLRHLGWLTAGE